MITRIQAKNYRCFRDLDLSLDRFHVMVGPNASGKSTLFDVVSFLADMLRDGLPAAIDKRTRNFQDLAWGRPRVDPGFELAVEIKMPDKAPELPRWSTDDSNGRLFRYEVAIHERDGEVRATREVGRLRTTGKTGDSNDLRTVFSHQGNDLPSFQPETGSPGATGARILGSSDLTASSSILSVDSYPATRHALDMLAGFVDRVVLDGPTLRRASSLACNRAFSRDGSSLPWNVQYLQEKQQDDYREWLRHVQTVLPELQGIRVVEREDDRHAYLMLRYENGVEVPSWMASEGTLRLLALTLITYLPVAQSYPRDRRSLHEIILIEEPDDGVHLLALDAIYDSLASVYQGQVLATTHSPSFLRLASPEETLCFDRSADGSALVVHGEHHPHARDWQETADAALLFGRGVLG